MLAGQSKDGVITGDNTASDLGLEVRCLRVTMRHSLLHVRPCHTLKKAHLEQTLAVRLLTGLFVFEAVQTPGDKDTIIVAHS